jgi:uncharacterized protein GlcG (DUF336 family)
MSVGLHDARAVIAAAREYGADAALRSIAVVVLDAGGHLVAAEREDGCSFARVDIARAKAFGALALGIGSRAIADRAVTNPGFVQSVTAVVGGAMVPAPGGVLVRDSERRLLGAVGVSGESGINDEAAAVAGILAAGLVPQPGEDLAD